jgi:hypothetical protein
LIFALAIAQKTTYDENQPRSRGWLCFGLHVFTIENLVFTAKSEFHGFAD